VIFTKYRRRSEKNRRDLFIEVKEEEEEEEEEEERERERERERDEFYLFLIHRNFSELQL